ncbi:BZ3500_MvSof-1268-A1-R1_Chr2-1g04527 [Microbotryum saponariae]|uniref:BZ3500_MvSof-1268-A1-R1_Chr2-1g04527 protein n=1 Tax=Microbotryum saponariae TaxID=289078 RepID=A0A2X0KB45_9BASI|nr:BZ3500_MvSof-1268-A1-R1_Chr2-1g04527 [Microbotryum saponariae]SCZ91928.1 BZ3501_MvSof-1269-A2-R1_Chr2-1g04183 [Microbotryum saponariae]
MATEAERGVPPVLGDEALPPRQDTSITPGPEGEISSFLSASLAFDFVSSSDAFARASAQNRPTRRTSHSDSDKQPTKQRSARLTFPLGPRSSVSSSTAGSASTPPGISAGQPRAGDCNSTGNDPLIASTDTKEQSQASSIASASPATPSARNTSESEAVFASLEDDHEVIANIKPMGLKVRRSSASSQSSNSSWPSTIGSLMSPTADSASRRSVFPLRNPPPSKHKKSVRASVVLSESELSLPGPSSEQIESGDRASAATATFPLLSPRYLSSPSPPASVASSNRSSTHASLPHRPPSKDPTPTSSTFTSSLRVNPSAPSFRGFPSSTSSPYQSSPYLSTPAGQAGPQSIFATPVGHKPKVGMSRLFAAATSKKQPKAAPLGRGTSTGTFSTRAASIFSTSSTTGFGPARSTYASSIATFETAQDSYPPDSSQTVAPKREDEEDAASRLEGLSIKI